jgi:hypothetical protein
MNIHVHGQGMIKLTKQNYLASGGAGDIYTKQGVAYKIFKDPDHVPDPAKITELTQINNPDVIKPEAVITSSNGRLIGYTMRYIQSAWSLCQVFPLSFKKRYSLDDQTILTLVDDFRIKIASIHSHGVCVVDLNELNFLVDKSFNRIYCIDVDNYQTSHFPAEYIMDSIRDRHSAAFDEMSDWFSWAICSFQLFIGIHPYKGKHPDISTLDERMHQNLSVFNSDVRVPAVCQPLDSIPVRLRDWYHAVFEKGERSLPPDGRLQVATWQPVHAPIPKKGKSINMELLQEYKSTITGHVYLDGKRIVCTDSGTWINTTRYRGLPHDTRFTLTPKTRKPVAAWLEDGKLHVTCLTTSIPFDVNIQGEQIMSSGEWIYVKSGRSIFEITMTELPDRIIVTPRTACMVIENATKLFDGLALQDLVGTWYLACFSGAGECRHVKLDELSGHRILDAYYKNGCAILVTRHEGDYLSVVIRLHKESHDLRISTLDSYNRINMTSLPNGVVSLVVDEELELFSNMPGSDRSLTVKNEALPGFQLSCENTSVVGSRGKRLYRVSMEK